MVNSQKPPIKKLYKRLVENCRTPNQFNRLHIAIENRTTPIEIHRLSEEISDHYANLPSAKWIGTLCALSNMSQKMAPEDYARRKVGPNLYLYSNQIPASSKTLIVGFPGGAGRLMMPNPVLLQHLTAADTDLLFINHRGPDRYEVGVPRLGRDFLELAASLAKIIHKLGYKRHVTFGTSAGGLPALVAAILLDADQGTSVGSTALEQEAWKQVLEHPKFRAAISRESNCPRLLAAYSESNDRDRMAARDVSEKLPLSLLPIHAEMHNTLWGLLISRQLSKFLSLVTMADQTWPPLQQLFPKTDHRTEPTTRR